MADCTLGMAGHAAEIVRRLGPQGHLIGFDRDPEALALAKDRLDNVASELGSQAPKIDVDRRSVQLHCTACRTRFVGWHPGRLRCQQPATGRGAQGIQFFGRRRSGHAYGYASGPTAAQVVNEVSERELADLIYEYGEERRSRRIARAIVRGRPVTTTGQLARIVATAAPAMKQDTNSSCDTHLSGSSYLCESRAGRNPGAPRGRTHVA